MYFSLFIFNQANLIGGEFLMCNVDKMCTQASVHCKKLFKNLYLFSRSGCCCKMKDHRVMLLWQLSISSVNEKGGCAKCLQRLLKYCHEVAKSSLQALLSVLNALFSRTFHHERKLTPKVKSSSHSKTETLTQSKHFNVLILHNETSTTRR